jgi:hypothetical protein
MDCNSIIRITPAGTTLPPGTNFRTAPLFFTIFLIVFPKALKVTPSFSATISEQKIKNNNSKHRK